MKIANKIAHQASSRSFDTDSLVLGFNPVLITYASDFFGNNTAEFKDGSWIIWNYKNEIEFGE